MKRALLLALVPALWSGAIGGQPAAPVTLDELLQQVRQTRAQEVARNARRERQFLAERDAQQRRLAEARAALEAERQRGEELQEAFDRNESTIDELRARLQERAGTLLQLFGVARQAAGQAKAVFEDSLVSTQHGGRSQLMGTLARSTETPGIRDLEDLWLALQQEMTESGKVASFGADVIGSDGNQREQRVTRVGVFNAVSQGRFLRYFPDSGWLQELPRQPAARYRAMAAGLEQAGSGMVPMVVDPSRGSVLALLVQAPDLLERIQQGRLVGYVIVGIAAIGLLIGIERALHLLLVGHRVRKQRKSDVPSPRNPLGRVMALFQESRGVDTATLELRLEELILKDTPRLQRGLQTLKILAVIAPLLGLLGTVTGLIETFQALTLYGTGDPRLMAGGISQALVTTVLGLVTAIALILLHTALVSKSRRLVLFLEEQSAGIMALHSERRAAGATGV